MAGLLSPAWTASGAATSIRSFELNSRSGTRQGCLYCSRLPPDFCRRRWAKPDHVPAGKGTHSIGASRPEARLSRYSQLIDLRWSSTCKASESPRCGAGDVGLLDVQVILRRIAPDGAHREMRQAEPHLVGRAADGRHHLRFGDLLAGQVGDVRPFVQELDQRRRMIEPGAADHVADVVAVSPDEVVSRM